jgi:hypothetical protein
MRYLDRPNSTTDGQWHEARACYRGHSHQIRPSSFPSGVDIEQEKFVGALRVVRPHSCFRPSSVAMVSVCHTFHQAASA